MTSKNSGYGSLPAVPEALVEHVALHEMPGGFHFDSCLHRSAEVLVCLTGTLTITILDQRIEILPGDYIAVAPNVLHCGTVPAGQPCRILQLRFHCDDLTTLNITSNIPSDIVFLTGPLLDKQKYLKGRSIAQLESCLKGVLEEFSQRRVGREQMLSCYVRQVVILLSRDLSARSGVPLCQNRHLIRAAQYISQHCTEKITVASVAEAVGISTRYLTRLFQEQMGLGASAYINDVRISRSISLKFQDPSYPLSRLALDLGFSSQQHFSKVFKDKMGVSPGKYFSRLPPVDR